MRELPVAVRVIETRRVGGEVVDGVGERHMPALGDLGPVLLDVVGVAQKGAHGPPVHEQLEDSIHAALKGFLGRFPLLVPVGVRRLKDLQALTFDFHDPAHFVAEVNQDHDELRVVGDPSHVEETLAFEDGPQEKSSRAPGTLDTGTVPTGDPPDVMPALLMGKIASGRLRSIKDIGNLPQSPSALHHEVVGVRAGLASPHVKALVHLDGRR